MKKHSLEFNMVIDAVNGILGILFPLITFPYVSRILGVENLGKFNFSSSFISYFVLFANLGISVYAIREGAKIRNNKKEFEKFISEIFSINLVSMTVSYIMLLTCCLAVKPLGPYVVIIGILSIQIFLKIIGVTWIFSIFEQYLYKTMISVLMYVVSLVCLFIFVKDSSDLYWYAAVNVTSIGASELVNFFHARKLCKIRVTRKLELKKHMKPILLLFAMSLAVSVYVSSDTIILGFLCDDYAVGIYAVSTRVYTILKTIVSSVVTVSIPRMASLAKENRPTEEFLSVGQNIYNTLLTVLIPTICGICLLRKEVICLISGSSYLEAHVSLMILAFALFFCLGVYFWGQAILVVLNKENILFTATVISALLNIILNMIMIPVWKQNAAAFTTLMSEFSAFLICRYCGYREARLNGIGRSVVKIAMGCVPIVLCCLLLRMLELHIIVYCALSITVSVILYVVVEILLKNDAISEILKMLLRRNKKEAL